MFQSHGGAKVRNKRIKSNIHREENGRDGSVREFARDSFIRRRPEMIS